VVRGDVHRHDLRSGPFSLYAVAPSIGSALAAAAPGSGAFVAIRAFGANERQAGGHERVHSG